MEKVSLQNPPTRALCKLGFCFVSTRGLNVSRAARNKMRVFLVQVGNSFFFHVCYVAKHWAKDKGENFRDSISYWSLVASLEGKNIQHEL